MATNKNLPMHPDFVRWLSAVGLGDQQAERDARWAGISTIVRSANDNVIEALIRVAFKTKQLPAADELNSVRQKFHDADANFAMQGNDKEMQVLAGASLAALMVDGGDYGATAALAATTTDFGATRKPKLPMNLPALAESAIRRIALDNRVRPLVAGLGAPSVKVDFGKAIVKVKENNPDAFGSAFAMAADDTQAALQTVLERTLAGIDKYLRVQDEELQMLWWLIGERSFELDCPFEAVGLDVQPFVFGKELATFTAFLPGPISVQALLARAGLKGRKKISVVDAVNATDALWLKDVVAEEKRSPVTMPIHLALQRKLETGAGDAWVAGWAAATELPADVAMTPLSLATQFYRERLLATYAEG